MKLIKSKNCNVNYLEDRADLEDSEDIYKMTPEQVMKIIDAITK